MKPYTVLTVPDPRLRQKAVPIEAVDDEIREIFERMVVTMDKEDGIGLAATQVGIDKRLVVMDVHDHEEGECGAENDGARCQLYRLANPEIIWRSDETEQSSEGCLSVPGQYAEVTRAQAIKMQYLDENNKTQTLEATGLLADCIQHEIDHLDGILFVDHLSAIKRKMLVQKAKKIAALEAAEKKNKEV